LTSSVSGSLTVLFFGDLFSASVATVGLNPSKLEYLDKSGNELSGPDRRFETLVSLEAIDRAGLSDDQCRRAILRMQNYFNPESPSYSWFRSLDRLTQAMGYGYEHGEVAHLDLSQEATDPTWTKLRRERPSDFAILQTVDLPFLQWQIQAFPLHTIVCNGRTTFDQVIKLVNGELIESGRIARIIWYHARAQVSGRSVCVLGWNLPLARPTGLGIAGEKELGKLLRQKCTDGKSDLFDKTEDRRVSG